MNQLRIKYGALCALLLMASTAWSADVALSEPQAAAPPSDAPQADVQAAAPVMQTPKPAPSAPTGADKGLYGRVVVGGGHDSLTGYSGDIEFSVGYAFNHSLEVEAGVPIYWLNTIGYPTNVGGNVLRYRYGSLGDVSLKSEFAPDIDAFDYIGTVTCTLPTGLTAVSAGRATWDLSNRFERKLWGRALNPFVEIGFGNVLPVTTRLAQASAINGVESRYRAGNSFNFSKSVSFHASFYEAFPLSGSSVGATPSSLASPILASDHGFMGSLLASHSRWDFDLTYTRSIPNRLDEVWVSIGFRLGHLRKESE